MRIKAGSHADRFTSSRLHTLGHARGSATFHNASMPRRHADPAPASRPAALIARALAHVEAHLDAPLTADVLADRAALSRHHFHRVFAAHVGCGVAEYVMGRRLQRAGALLASGREPVLEVALAVGYESAQALAKAMRRELNTTPTAVRRGETAAWTTLLQRARSPWAPHDEGELAMELTRIATLPASVVALTATARGMVDRHLSRAAQQAYGELVQALDAAGLRAAATSWMALCPDDPQGPDDPNCRYVAGVVFGHQMADSSGVGAQPEVALSGSLAWQAIAPGRCAVFTHIGPYAQLHRSWTAIYRDWLPSSGHTLRDAPPMELMLNSPQNTAPEALHTEIWVPIV
ncbi:MAG: hypothetical protein RJA98_885 [Pseudomonadota bacterium]